MSGTTLLFYVALEWSYPVCPPFITGRKRGVRKPEVRVSKAESERQRLTVSQLAGVAIVEHCVPQAPSRHSGGTESVSPRASLPERASAGAFIDASINNVADLDGRDPGEVTARHLCRCNWDPSHWSKNKRHRRVGVDN